MNRIWVFNTSPLIALGHLGLLGSIEAVVPHYSVPHGVIEEILAGPPGDPCRLFLESNLQEVPLARVEGWPAQIACLDLGKGESDVLACALAQGMENIVAVLDDRIARRAADQLGIRVVGTVGFLLKAKRAGIVGDLDACIQILLKKGMRLSPALVERALILSEKEG